MRDIMSSFSAGHTPRPVQVDILRAVEKVWARSDVIVINAPVALGKSFLAHAISKFSGKSALVTPTKILVDQYLRDFPKMEYLKSKDDYTCDGHDSDGETSCASAARLRSSSSKPAYCYGCPYTTHLRRARSSRQILCNYYTYMANKLYRPTLVVDEAHNLIPLIQDIAGGIIWDHKVQQVAGSVQAQRFHSARDGDGVLRWLGQLSPRVRQALNLDELYLAMNAGLSPYVFERTWEEYRGDPRPCIRLYPVDIRDHPPVLWPKPQVEKLVLLSATIGRKDVEALGLGPDRGVKTTYITAPSPIPAASRPITFRPVLSLGYGQVGDAEIRRLAAEIVREARRPGNAFTRGIVHLTYGLSRQLQKSGHLDELGDRVIWHTAENKMPAYQSFLSGDVPNGILMACGLSEGIDLVGELGRWQVIAKVPWPSLSDPAIRSRADSDEEWYIWQAAKVVMQASGRICRTPSDYGSTLILDKSFRKIYDEYRYMLPDWFVEAISVDRGV